MDMEKLYDLSKLRETMDGDQDTTWHVQDFLNTTLDKDITRLYRSFLNEKRFDTARIANKLKLSLNMYGVHNIKKDLEKVEYLASTTEQFEEIGPLLKNIKNHLRNVKNQIIQDYKMVITFVD